MKGRRLMMTLALWTMRSSVKRTEYLRKKNVFAAMGENCSIMKRSVPLYAKLIRFGSNVRVASNVGFVTHDITHTMLNRSPLARSVSKGRDFQEKLGCIDIGDNVFIGSGSRILYNVRIGSNVVIGSGSIVNRDIPDNSVAAGVPARVIGSFEDFVRRRAEETPYPAHLKPRGESVGKELSEFMWRQFEESRQNGADGPAEPRA